jgi:hypothetical protein
MCLPTLITGVQGGSGTVGGFYIALVAALAAVHPQKLGADEISAGLLIERYLAMSDSPQFLGMLGQKEIVVIQTILHENDATEEEMKKLFEESRMRKLLTEALQEVRAEILVQHEETSQE